MKWNLEWSRLFWQGAAASTMDTTKKSGSGTTTTSLASAGTSKHSSVVTRMITLANQALSVTHKPSDAVRLLPKPNAKLFTPRQNNLLWYNRAVLHY